MSGGPLLISEKEGPQHTHHVLLSNKTLDETLRVLLLEYLREGGALAVAVQHNNSIICMAQLSQSQTTCFLSSNLLPTL